MDPTPWRSLKRRHALGASTATHRRPTRTSRITIVTPPTTYLFLRGKAYGTGFSDWWMVGKCKRRPRQHLSALHRFVPRVANPNQERSCHPAHGRVMVASDGATPPPAVGAADRDRYPEARGDGVRGDRVGQVSGGGEPP